jgi:hypothetical protein
MNCKFKKEKKSLILEKQFPLKRIAALANRFPASVCFIVG